MVYGAMSRVLFPVAAIALVGAGMWGYQEHNEKNSILIKAENQYQRAFHELNYHLDKLHDELGKSIAINSRKQATPCLTNVWRLAYAAQSDVGQLPLTLIPFNNTEEFLAKVADFSYDVAIRDLNQQPLSQKEYQTLQSLYKHSTEIQNDLAKVQTKVLSNKLRWMDVETALASDDKKSDNTIIDGFRTVDKKVQEYDDLDWGVTVQSLDKKKQQRIKGLDGKQITKEEAGKIALQFLGINRDDVSVDVEENGKAEAYSAYSVRIVKKSDGQNPINLDISKRGGQVVWLLNEREVQNEQISLEEAERKGKQFLQSRDFKNMIAVESDSYGGLGVFTFVPEQNGVRIYPDAVEISIALDNGEVNGFQAEEYLFNHKQRMIPKPKISVQKARSMVNPNVKVTEQRLAIIEGKDGTEKLCYEFSGNLGEDTYMIYINANNGDEEDIVKMDTLPGEDQT
ncbi:germination protein YpeB [Brevibacillus sp. SYSU BS000544]|uniref:germination protein YpeB n=1 Tax=Brevibacillus sp. SYSU BS000544 TaxID=3416443 RepID=UPI003CE464C2